MNEMMLRVIQTQLFGSSLRSRYWAPLPVPVPVRGLDLQMARHYVGQLLPADYRYAALMYEGEHWQGGWGWAGPMLDPTDPGYQQTWWLIAKGFVSRNLLKQIVDRHVNGVLARMPKWTLMPIEATTGDEEMPEALRQTIADATAFLRDWVSARGVHQMLKNYLVDLLMPTGRGSLRFWIPPGLSTELQGSGGAVRQLNVGDSVGEALRRIYLEKPPVTDAAVVTDPDTQRQVGIRLMREPDRAWLTFLDAEGQRTFVRSVNNEGGGAGVSYDLGGRLLMFQGRREPLVTRQFLQMQRALNFAESVIPRTNETAGFLQRIITNAQLQGTWEKDPETGALKFTPDPNATPVYGAGITNYFSGQVLEDEDGKLQQATPGVHVQEPITPNGAIVSAEHFSAAMHVEGHQAHLVRDSGIPPEIARQEYALSLLDSAIPVVEATTWILGTGLALAEALRGEVGRFTEQLRPSVSAVVNIGPVSPEEKTAMIAAFEKAVLARETVQETAFSVEDVDAENDRIRSQPGAAIDVFIRQVNAIKMAKEAGITIEDAALEAGIAPDVAQRWQTNADAAAKKTADQAMAQAELQARAGRPSGTAERNPGQGQDKTARKLQSKPRDRKNRRAGGATGAGPA